MASNPNTIPKLDDIVGEAILQQKPCVVLRNETMQDDVRKAIRVYMRKHPEIFWFSHQYHFDESDSTLYLKYNFTPEKKAFFSKEIDNAVRFLFQPENLKNLLDLEKVAYVYKWIVNNTTYNEYSSFNQTIYSVLINRNSVCTGYAKTAQYLLGILGIESELVFGKFHADKSEGGRHGWNIVKIDGGWYHVDFCLADPYLRYLLNEDESPIEFDGLLWNYFCKPTDYILKNRSIEFLEQYPNCNKEISKRFKIALAKLLKQLAVCKSDSGTTAKVYLDSFNKNQVIKISRHDSSLIENEYGILNQLDGCKHIIQLVDRNDNGLVLEQLTPWSELLNSHYYHPNESQLKDILIQLAEGLIECRDKGISYSDIHYNNVFVSKDGTYKWGDFGIAFPSTSDGHLPSLMFGVDGIALGSRWFMSPETYRNGIFTESSAIYSLAMLAYFVMNDMRPPFWDKNSSEQEVLCKRLSANKVYTPIYSTRFPYLSKFVCEILNAEQPERIKTLENFIKSLILIVSEVLSNEEDIIIIDNINNEGIIEIENDGNAKISSMDTDRFDCTMGGICDNDSCNIDSDGFAAPIPFEESIDSDNFASTAIPNIGHDRWGDGLTHDTDSFARTCGFGPTATPPQRHQGGNGSSAGSSTPCPQQYESSTSYSPSETKVRSRIKDCAPKSSFGIGEIVGGVFKAIGGLFTGFAAGTSKSEKQQDIQSEINACVYAPVEVRPHKSFVIRVYMYKPEEQNAVDSKVKEIDTKAVKKEYKPLDIPVNLGDELTVQLNLSEGVVCRDSVKSVTWRGHYTDCSFSAKLMDELQESIDGTAYVFINDVPAGEMLFTIDVVESEPAERYAKIDARRFSRIFISYAHQDETQVRGIAEGCRMLGKDYFFDRHSLQAGDIFKDKILNYIDRADLFVLCWSKNAAESEWVQIEREHALRLIREGKSTLSIYPLCLRPEAPLPIDMADKYNFGTL